MCDVSCCQNYFFLYLFPLSTKKNKACREVQYYILFQMNNLNASPTGNLLSCTLLFQQLLHPRTGKSSFQILKRSNALH